MISWSLFLSLFFAIFWPLLCILFEAIVRRHLPCHRYPRCEHPWTPRSDAPDVHRRAPANELLESTRSGARTSTSRAVSSTRNPFRQIFTLGPAQHLGRTAKHMALPRECTNTSQSPPGRLPTFQSRTKNTRTISASRPEMFLATSARYPSGGWMNQQRSAWHISQRVFICSF